MSAQLIGWFQMFRYFPAALMVMLCLTAIPNGMAVAQTNPSDPFLETIRTSIVRTIGAQDNTVEVSAKGNIFTVERVNSNMNDSTHGGRNNEASAISTVVSKAIADKADFKTVITIRVQYSVRYGSAADTKVIDTVEFRRDPNGVFQFHTT